ncbi:hypothetical protein MPTK1_1g24260 [Marchantia polymorpha subsp. ruderalis]|uniref:Uncharacterized protein n=2 Tax=Marchantia polymorpha TaxID=3197 RepID=A0AAF6ATR7_MARPO|nr:hypothetical protein MARPO_0061s0095 [Marchantia polymorpha]BBM99837.1 hypothetical protein Mp_1g24260 [Marchantia polymorpha subsp. ruderalis]|eukprot:PTQ36848.1 hypothetical protein MARPO_0061s0095 [Marchantia polymorpha]
MVPLFYCSIIGYWFNSSRNVSEWTSVFFTFSYDCYFLAVVPAFMPLCASAILVRIPFNQPELLSLSECRHSNKNPLKYSLGLALRFASKIILDTLRNYRGCRS